jgi:hypothetical protein
MNRERAAKRPGAGAAAAATLGAAAFAFGVGLGTLDPRRLDRILIGGIDRSIHFLGWHMFRSSSERRPARIRVKRAATSDGGSWSLCPA